MHDPVTAQLFPALLSAAAEGLEVNVRHTWGLLRPSPGHYVEVQVYGPMGNFYAHAASADELVAAATWVDAQVPAFKAAYVITNPVSAERVHRDPRCPPGLWYKLLHGSTVDKDIATRGTVYMDFDAPRAKDTSATDEELAAVVAVAERVYLDLASLLGGYDSLAIGLSGNGCALFVALDHLSEAPELRKLVDRALRAVKALYETDKVKIDAHLSDPKRLVPLFGTVKRKGPANDPLRPHRRTSILIPQGA